MRDLIVIGGGPAGIGAALQADNQGLDVLLVEARRLGGRLAHARRVRNFPCCEGPGTAVARRLAAQVKRRGIMVVQADCQRIAFAGASFSVHCPGKKYLARTVILATGVRPRSLPGFSSAVASGYWDDLRVKPGDRVAVIGGGETAFDQACSLAGRKAAVFLLLRGTRPRAHQSLVRDAAALGVRVLTDVRIMRINRSGRTRLIMLADGRSLTAHHVLLAIGSVRCPPPVSKSARAHRDKGLYYAGDLRRAAPRQAAIAFAGGVAAAMRAYEYLKEHTS